MEKKLLTRSPHGGQEDIELIDYKAAAKILGLAPKTVANGAVGTGHLQRRLGPKRNVIRYIKSEVIALRDAWLARSSER